MFICVTSPILLDQNEIDIMGREFRRDESRFSLREWTLRKIPPFVLVSFIRGSRGSVGVVTGSRGEERVEWV